MTANLPALSTPAEKPAQPKRITKKIRASDSSGPQGPTLAPGAVVTEIARRHGITARTQRQLAELSGELEKLRQQVHKSARPRPQGSRQSQKDWPLGERCRKPETAYGRSFAVYIALTQPPRESRMGLS
jgi:hypothetical protein